MGLFDLLLLTGCRLNNQLLITCEIFLVIVVPLLVLYLRSNWPLRAVIASLLIIPPLWYLTYAPLHELSHVVGTYAVGGRVIYYKLIPSFWAGEFGRAWITTEGISQSWRQLVSTSFPYIVDIICIAIGFRVLRRDFSRNPLVVGLAFMLLCLRPAFDFVCEPIAFLAGDKGDLFTIQGIIGSTPTWVFILLSFAISFLSIESVLKRFAGYPESPGGVKESSLQS